MRLTHIRLLVPNVKECFDFYKDILGFKVLWGENDDMYAEFDTGQTRISLNAQWIVNDVLGQTNKPLNPDSQEKTVLVLEVDDVDAMHHVLQEKGVEFLTPPHDQTGWGVRVAHFRDPAGNLIEINKGL